MQADDVVRYDITIFPLDAFYVSNNRVAPLLIQPIMNSTSTRS
jgi:hypothetical protein